MTDVVVVGGGLAGLAAADRLAEAGAEVTLLEAADRLGGNVYTTSFADRALDLGAELLLTRDPAAIDLCHELSLGDALVTPAQNRSYVWTRRGLRPLPSDAIGRMPGGLAQLLRSRLLSPRGHVRWGLDLIVPSRAPDGDVAIGAVVRSRLGREVLEQIVDPLLGGVHAGRCDTLSARALAPQLVEALATGKGVTRGLRDGTAGATGPMFATLRQGLGSLAASLAARAEAAGAKLRLGVSAVGVNAARPGRVDVDLRDGDALQAKACVVATPARAAATMLARAAPAVAVELATIIHARTAVVALAYPAEALADLPAGTGFVTAGEERLVRACTWSSSKWEHLSGEPAIVKAFVGRADAPPPTIGDRELAAAVHRELSLALRLRHAPVEVRIAHFGAAIPQYFVGHLERLDRIAAELPADIALAGGSYRGAGVSACLRSGRAAAGQILGHLSVSGDKPVRSYA
jgi:protoporphyrinogen/coproporphyrinogen III oxidase